MEGDADGSRGDIAGGIGVFRQLARRPEVGAWWARAQGVCPYLVGAAMFGVAVWVLHRRCAAIISPICTPSWSI